MQAIFTCKMQMQETYDNLRRVQCSWSWPTCDTLLAIALAFGLVVFSRKAGARQCTIFHSVLIHLFSLHLHRLSGPVFSAGHLFQLLFSVWILRYSSKPWSCLWQLACPEKLWQFNDFLGKIFTRDHTKRTNFVLAASKKGTSTFLTTWLCNKGTIVNWRTNTVKFEGSSSSREPDMGMNAK